MASHTGAGSRMFGPGWKLLREIPAAGLEIAGGPTDSTSLSAVTQETLVSPDKTHRETIEAGFSFYKWAVQGR